MTSQQGETPQAESSAGTGTTLQNQTWGKWERSHATGPMRHYSLDVIQHPIRARMCGFGDKDRRPLAPAAIAKLIVRNEDREILTPDEIEIDFFLVTCDLWSADGQVEVNLVRNPSAAAASRRRNRENPAGQSGSDDGETYSAAPSGSSRAASRDEPPLYASQAASAAGGNPNWNPQWVAQQQQQQPWGQPGSYLDTSRPAGYQDPAFAGQVPQGGPSPAWSQEASPHPQGIGELPIATYSGEIGSQPAQAATVPQVMQVPSSRPERDRDVTGQYTRTLVGPLSANAARLLDDKKQPGIFFTFQDLSVRTEGTFRLRLRLVNVGAPPAPNSGAIRVHEHISPVLAQTFTEPFTVFSAKKFPGVPQMTALSLEFGKQGQKLPLRNRPGSGGKPGRGPGSEDEEEGVESGGEEGGE